jgi:hypothetical protein
MKRNAFTLADVIVALIFLLLVFLFIDKVWFSSQKHPYGIY